MQEKSRFLNKKTILNGGKVWVNCDGIKEAISKNGINLGGRYWVTRDGDLASTVGSTFKILKPRKAIDGYVRTSFTKMVKGVSESKSVAVHRIVAEIFIGEIPDGYVVDHINRVRDDNHVENLRIVTVLENNLNRNKNEFSSKGQAVNAYDYDTGEFVGTFSKIKVAAETLQLSTGNISQNIRHPEKKPFVGTGVLVKPKRRYVFEYCEEYLS